MYIGVVSEGPSDYIILKTLITAAFPSAETLHLHPSPAALELGAGWNGVRRWCKKFCAEPSMISLIDRPLDFLVIHVDCSMAWHFDIGWIALLRSRPRQR